MSIIMTSLATNLVSNRAPNRVSDEVIQWHPEAFTSFTASFTLDGETVVRTRNIGAKKYYGEYAPCHQ